MFAAVTTSNLNPFRVKLWIKFVFLKHTDGVKTPPVPASRFVSVIIVLAAINTDTGVAV